MDFEERRLVAWEVLPRVHVLRVVREPTPYLEVAYGGGFWRVPATRVLLPPAWDAGTVFSLLALPGGAVSLRPQVVDPLARRRPGVA